MTSGLKTRFFRLQVKLYQLLARTFCVSAPKIWNHLLNWPTTCNEERCYSVCITSRVVRPISSHVMALVCIYILNFLLLHSLYNSHIFYIFICGYIYIYIYIYLFLYLFFSAFSKNKYF